MVEYSKVKIFLILYVGLPVALRISAPLRWLGNTVDGARTLSFNHYEECLNAMRPKKKMQHVIVTNIDT